MLLSEEQIRSVLRTSLVGKHLCCSAQTGSTNDDAKHLAECGAPEGWVVVADYQTAGRGRMGRSWDAPPASSLLLSVLFRPRLAVGQVHQVAMLCGLAVADAIERATGLEASLKWPNDVLLDGAKIAGLLTEVGFHGDSVAYVVVGIGLNVNVSCDGLPKDLPVPATSLCEVLGRSVDRLSLLQVLLERVEARYLALVAGESPWQEWVSRLATVGKPVSVVDGERVMHGWAESVDEYGALWVRLPVGDRVRVVAGDVAARREAGW